MIRFTSHQSINNWLLNLVVTYCCFLFQLSSSNMSKNFST